MPQPVARVVWREGMTFDAKTASGHEVILDSTKKVADSKGPSPVELLMTALAGCTAMDIVNILQKMREPLEGLEVSASGVRREQEPRIFTHIEVVYRVRGRVKPEAVERAIELSRTKYCTVEGMIEKTAHVTARYEIVE